MRWIGWRIFRMFELILDHMKIVGLVLLVLSVLTGSAQEFGGNPPSIRWRQVNTDTVRVIFPEGMDSLAQRVAAISLKLASLTRESIGNRVKKINIVLQSNTTISNGYVALGPFRSEFHLTPDPNSFVLGSLPWDLSLAIHEYRHVQQYNNFKKGFASVFHALFGQEGQALANALTIPDWFFEGDAVYQETLVSEQGRGRLPYFFNSYNSLWAAGKKYSWMKLRNGSFRDFVPNHYPLGYMLVAYGREKYGTQFWKDVTADAASWNRVFYPLQKAIRKYSAKSYANFREDALKHFDSAVTKKPTTVSRHFLANQEFPQWIDSTTVVFAETSFTRLPQFKIFSNGAERKLRVRDVSSETQFSYKSGKIVYAAYRPDIRWGWRDYSEIRMIDVNSGAQKTITKKSKYFSPDISEDGKTIIAVHVEAGKSELHLLDSNGTVTRKISSGNLFYTNPKFFRNQIVTPVRDKDGRMTIAIIDPETGNHRQILPYTYNVIGFPSVENNAFYFTASYDGRDRIFKWNNELLLLKQDGEGVGDYHPSAGYGRIAWNTFTASGSRLTITENEPSKWIKVDPSAFAQNPGEVGITSLESDQNKIVSSIEPKRLPVQHYSKATGLFNFHSRRPFINDPDYSFSFVSENILSTLISELFVNYNRNEQYKQLGFSASYAGLFPVLNFRSQYTFDRNARVRINQPRAYWNEWESGAGVQVPLNLSNGKHFTRLTIGADYIYNQRNFTGLYKDSFENRGFGYVNSLVGFSNQIQSARTHIHPRFAQTLFLSYKRAVNNLEGEQFLATGNLYLPGFFNNHNIVLQGGFHIRDTMSNIRFSNSFPFSRGYSTENFYRMWKAGANYHFPLVYPDWGFGNIIYFLRIRSNLFYDFTRINEYNRSGNLVTLDFRSFGTEIFFDTKWWNQLPVSFGIRYSRLMDADLEGRGANQFEFVVPVNLIER